MKTEEQLRQWAAYEEITKWRAEQAGILAHHEHEIKTALAEAARWAESRQIRQYVEAVRSHAISAQGEAWCQWAERVADEMDPAPRRAGGGA